MDLNLEPPIPGFNAYWVRFLVALQEHDQHLAKVCEEKIQLQFELLEVCGHEDVPSPPSLSQRYTTDLDMVALRDQLRQTVQVTSLSF